MGVLGGQTVGQNHPARSRANRNALAEEIFRLESHFSHLGPDGPMALDAALAQASAGKDTSLLVRALCLKARADVFLGRVEEGIGAAEHALALIAELPVEVQSPLSGIASEAWRTAGRAYFKLGNLAEAFPRLETAVLVAEAASCGSDPTSGDPASPISAVTALPRALHDLGVAFMAVREVGEAIETYTRGIAACDAQPEVYRLVPDDVLLLLTGWAGALQQRHENDLFGQSGETATADLSAAAGILTGRARTLIDNAEKAAAEGATPLSGYGYQSYFSALGRQYLLTGDPVAAAEQFERQLAQGIAVGNAVVCASGEIGIANACLAQDDFAAALPHAQNAITRLSENDEAGIRAEAFLTLSRIHSGLGDSQRALSALRSYNLVRDMIQAKDAKLYASYLASRIGLARVRAEADAQRRIADDLAFLNTKLEEQTAALSLQSQELDAARRAAEAANNAKSAFLANMSHELRTPLNAILGFSELMQRREIDATVAGYAQDIHQAGSHLLAIINDILDLSRIDAGKVQLEIEAITVADLFAECRKLIADKAAAAGLEIITSIEDQARTIRGDGLRLRQILLNLLSNAVKFTPPGGTLTIAASMSDPSMAVLSVSDTGCGMSDPEIEVALQPFGMVDGSLSRIKQGTGLGLPLAVRLTALHGGELTIESEPGRGTRVGVRLPQD